MFLSHIPGLKKIDWYVNRLRAMSAAELRHRLRERLLVEHERMLARRGTKLVSFRPDTSVEPFISFREEQDCCFFFSSKERDTVTHLWRSLFTAEKQATLQKADALLNGDICLFGKDMKLGDRIDWSRDPLTGRSWPRIFWADIDVRDGQSISGVKWVWELNRHHHLITLAKAYFLSGKERYAEAVCEQLENWIEDNLPGVGVNWTSSLELAIRLINWSWSLAFIRRSSALTSTLLQTILKSIAEQAARVSRHLSAYSSANNHLIGEAAGLAVVGLCFPWLANANKWRDTGLTILERELEQQIYPDGVPAEQAISYLGFVLDFNLMVWELAEQNGFTVPPIWYKRLEAACDFLQHVMDEKGNVPAIGDSDDGWVVQLDDRLEVNNYRSILATAAVLLNRADFKASAGEWDEKSHWLLGNAGFSAYQALPSNGPPIGSRAFRTGGYCVMRAPGQVTTFDCGPLGYLSTAAHGHADALSITISVDGQPFLVDPGTYAYQEGGAWRDYFRSTAAHNTVTVDRRDQSEMQGTFLWGSKAVARLLNWRTTVAYDFAVAEHNGYGNAGIVHRRFVLFHKPDWILIADDLRGEGQHQFEQLWHWPAHTQVAVHGEYVKIAVGQQQGTILPVKKRPQIETVIYNGEKSPIQGWISPHYSQLDSAPVVGFSGQCVLPLQLMTLFCFASESTDSELSKQAADIVGLFDKLKGEVED